MVVESGGERQGERYDVAIVGGRPAGASLAARLGEAGLRVLIVEKASFPSLPAVSAPFLLPHALALVDELGIDEAAYTAGTPRLEGFVLEIGDYFRNTFPFVAEPGDREYFYTIDRGLFDQTLWDNLGRFPNVHAVSGAKVVELLRDEAGRPCGVIVDRAGAREEHRASAVIGADGRFSMVARSVGAAVTEERTDVSTTIYYDFWQGIQTYDDSGAPLAQIYSSCDGYSCVAMPTSDDQTIVLVQGRADSFAALGGDAEGNYEALLRARPRIWRRLEGCTRRGKVVGMKRVGNLFREPGGDGWALVGDAYHQKDSIDAQGIYDALLGAKYLAEEILRWHGGERAWDDAVACYGERIYAACKPMFDSTMARLQREIYSEPPPMVAKTMMRWMLSDPEYGHRFALLMSRKIEPSSFLPPAVVLKLAAKGALRRLRRRLSGSDPTDPYGLPAGL